MDENIKLKNDLLYKEAISLAENNNFDEAIEYCNDMIRNNANDVDAWDIKAVCYFAKNNFSEALLCIEKVIELNPNDKLAEACRNNCLNVIQNDEMMEILKNLENLHKAGILTLEEYQAMRKLAFDEFYRQTKY
jgi:tetratricopeptide (TPR) repeat protein